MRSLGLVLRGLVLLALMSTSLLVDGVIMPAAAAVVPGQSCGSYALTPPAGGRSLVVAKDGTGDYSTINAAAQAAVAGDVVTIKDGTYAEAVTVLGSGTATQPIVFQAAGCARVTLTGTANSFRGGGFVVNQSPQSANAYVFVRGVNFVDFGTALTGYHEMAAVNMTLGWKLEDVSLRNAGGWAAVQIRGHQAAVDQTTIAASPYNAIHATGACCTETAYGAPGQLKALRITNTVLQGNNTAKHDPGWEAVTKFMHTDDLVVDNVESSGNFGPGLWLDWQNYRYAILNSNFHDNRGVANAWNGSGVLLEINSDNGRVESSRFAGNTGPDLLISSSSQVTVRGNVFQGSSTDSSPQIEFHRGRSDGACGRPAPASVRIENNQFLDWGGQWQWAAVATSTDPSRSWTCPQETSPVSAGHLLNFNTYRKAAHSGPLMDWEGTQAASTSAMQSLWGYEKGTSTPTPTPTPTTTSTTTSTTAPPSAPADTIAPTVTIKSPTSGAVLGRSTTVTASATDNVKVVKMELYIDGSRRATTSTGSLSYTWNTKQVTSGTHTVVVKAYDAAGKVGQATVSVKK